MHAWSVHSAHYSPISPQFTTLPPTCSSPFTQLTITYPTHYSPSSPFTQLTLSHSAHSSHSPIPLTNHQPHHSPSSPFGCPSTGLTVLVRSSLDQSAQSHSSAPCPTRRYGTVERSTSPPAAGSPTPGSVCPWSRSTHCCPTGIKNRKFHRGHLSQTLMLTLV